MFKRGLFFLLLLTVQCAAWAGKNVIFTTPEEYQLFRISPNGQWACGMYVDYSNNTYGFRWNLVSGNIELLSTNEQSEAWSISDNGVVAGACTVKLDGQVSRSLPALYYDDEWHVLELPTSTVAQGIAYDITPDGQYVVASLAYSGNGPYEAYIWKDGKIHRQLSDMGGGCPMPYCISPDGQTAGGWKTNYTRQACLWNADGTVTVLSAVCAAIFETVRVSDHFSGSKALSIGAQEQFFEPMDVYRFAFPQMSVTIAGEPADDYGWQDAALSGQLTDANYGGVYGWDNGEVILDTGTTGRGNLLMLGESYDNAILKLMASHFGRVCSGDLRSYEQDMGKPFRLAEYLREHEITKVLWIGSTTFFTSDDFMVED